MLDHVCAIPHRSSRVTSFRRFICRNRNCSIKRKISAQDTFNGLLMYRDLLLDQLSVNFLGPAPLDLELLHMLTTFHWDALGSTLGWWFCHNNTVSCNEKFWVEQVTVAHPPWGRTKGGGGNYLKALGVHCQASPLNQPIVACRVVMNTPIRSLH